MSEQYDILIIGAGVGGLITACQLGQAGKRVLLIENLSFLGGRFTAFKVNGSEVSSGAFHTFPHGDRGPFAQALRRSGVAIDVPPTKIFASFHVNKRHVVAKTGFNVFDVYPNLSDKMTLIKILYQAKRSKEFPGSFGQWLIKLGIPEHIRLIFDRFCQFAISATIYDIPYVEGRKIMGAIGKYGLPGIPVGGAREVAKQLGITAKKHGVYIRKNTRAIRLLSENGRICGAVIQDRKTGINQDVFAPIVISNAGPANTNRMAVEVGLECEQNYDINHPPLPAVGLKIQVLSPKSLIDHDSIMFCLDTNRIAGILQATNVDPNLAPHGYHLLISHQVISRGVNWQNEFELALQDWKYLFGKDFDNCQVLGTSNFPDLFPVNWAIQGLDLRTQPYAKSGLWLVGDGLKPQGLMMIEGVAASAEAVVAEILGYGNINSWETHGESALKSWGRRISKWTIGRLIKMR